MQNEELIKAGRQSADAIKTASLRATIMYQLCDALEAADKAQMWIPVNERLPEDAESYYKENEVYPKYLVMHPNSSLPRILCFDGHNFCNGFHNYVVAYWQPLPQPPQKGE